MKLKYISFFVAILFSFMSFSQIEYSASIYAEKLQTNTIPIRIFLNEQVDARSLNETYKSLQLSKAQRGQDLIQKLKANQAEQASILKYLEEIGATQIQSFWIINMISCKIDISQIPNLQNLKGVSDIVLNDQKIAFVDDKLPSPSNIQKSPGGVENGLEAINVRPLWEMGYTGRGKIAYTYDTGIWPTHPSISNNFIGNYQPIDHAYYYYYYFQEEPNGNISSHGTHVTGTMMGLDPAENDTIGVAWNAYFIANDLVTSTVAALPPIDEMVLAFEWALNPDNDLSTMTDIPDVINNSWRWYDGVDTMYCEGFVVDLMNTLEAAGIAVVFSGGNHGPSNTTISSPQRINTSIVNTFSVGSINGNNIDYPISSFSSRGPKQCEGTGSLLIHPEVVAPGQNVRSAWGTDGYNTISGTSMASPHVSGVVLLLKEAFPMASGEEILTAIYYSAVDLGEVGEDNVFGNGLIDAYAAFNLLSQSFTPAPPINGNDLKIASATLSNANEFTCSSMEELEVVISNTGNSTAYDLTISYGLVGNLNTEALLDSLEAGESITHNISNISLTPGPFELAVKVASSTEDVDLINNQKMIRGHVISSGNFPFYESFEVTDFEYNNWYRANPDVDEKWDTTQVLNGLQWSEYAMHFPFSTEVTQNNEDGLISPIIDLPITEDSITFTFDYSYNHRHNAFSDTLEVLISTDCGMSWETLFYLGGEDLNTSNQTTTEFYPLSSEEWKKHSINLDSFAGSSVQLQFKAHNRRGNNLFIDNVKIFGNELPASISIPNVTFQIFPNPAVNRLHLETTNNLSFMTVEIYDLTGKIIKQYSISHSNAMEIDISELSKGLYPVKVIHPFGTYHYEVIKL